VGTGSREENASKLKLACIDPAAVARFWPLARDLIKQAIDRTGLCDFADLEAECLAGQQLLWLAHNGSKVEAAATTQLIEVGGVKICVVVACGGKDRARWLAHLGGIEDYARNEGCARMRIYGRKGWERVLRSYRAKHVILEKGLF
jgi:hypothetical protein